MGAEQSAPLAQPALHERITSPLYEAWQQQQKPVEKASTPRSARDIESPTASERTASDSSDDHEATVEESKASAAANLQPSADPGPPSEPPSVEVPEPIAEPPSEREEAKPPEAPQAAAASGSEDVPSPTHRSTHHFAPLNSTRQLVRKASSTIVAKQSAIAALVQRINDGTPPQTGATVPTQLCKPAVKGENKSPAPAKRWPAVIAATGKSDGTHGSQRVMARYDMVTHTLHGVGTGEIVRGASRENLYRGSADVWGEEEDEKEEEEPQDDPSLLEA